MNILAEEQKKLLDIKLTEEDYKKREKEFSELYYQTLEREGNENYFNLTLEQLKSIHDEILTVLNEEEYKEKEAEFLKLYYELREKEDSRFYSKMTLEQRQKLHGLILAIYTIKNKLGGFAHEIIGDKRNITDKPIIYAITHVGKFDIEVISEAIKDHYYLLSGDFEHIQGIIDAPFLGVNGVLYFNETVKEDRKEVCDKMINLLKDGGSLMYFPEGTWNLKPELPLLPCYWGIVDIAKATNAIIVPVAACQYGKYFKINIGENFDMNKYADTKEDKSRAITDLRDTLASLSWDIYETEKLLKRDELNGDEWVKYIEDRFKEWPYFNEEYINGLIYKPKNVVEHDEVYAPVKKLVPNKNNAFLFDKRLKDDIFR